MSETRKIAAILVADVAGYSRLAGADEDRTLARLRALRSDLIDPTIAVHHGRVVKRTGDGAVVEFRSVIEAVRSAVEVQDGMVERNAGLPPERRIEFRVGIHLGDIVEESDGDLMGDGVNIAARLEGICEVGGICISEDAYRQVRDKIKEEFVDLGEQSLKNIARPVRAYQVISDRSSPRTEPTLPEPASTPLVLPDKPSIAVLPFQNMSGDPEQEYFADGIVEDIITALSRFKSFAVVARNSSFVYKGRAIDVREAAKELGVRYVLEGSVRRAGPRLRITAQLVEANAGSHLWAEKFDGTVEDIFDVQDRITESVVGVIGPRIQQAEIERARRKRPENLDAYDLYLRALAKTYTMNAEDNPEAFRLSMRAIALEPDHAPFLANAIWSLGHGLIAGWPALTGDDRTACLDLVRRALANAQGDAAVLAQCGGALIFVGRDYDRGMQIVANAVAANPNNPFVLMSAATVELHCGSLDDALAHSRRAIVLSPGDPRAHWPMTAIAHAHMARGEYEEALSEAARSLAVNSNYDPTYWMLIAANAKLGRMDEARDWLAKFQALSSGITIGKIRSWQPAKDPSRMAAILEGLRLAGLDEG